MDKLNLGEKIEKDESIIAYELHEYQSDSSLLNTSGEKRIRINNQNVFLDISESYLEMEGQLVKKDGSEYKAEDKVSLINNALMFLFSNIKYKVSGKEIENLNYPGETTTMLGYLKYSENFEKTEGLNQLWYREKSTHLGKSGFDIRHYYIIEKPNTKGSFNFLVPLKHIFGFCETYNNVMYGFEHELSFYRKQNDEDAVITEFEKDGETKLKMTSEGKVRLDKLSWFVPHVTPELKVEENLLKQMKNRLRYEVLYKMLEDANITIPQGSSFNWVLPTKASPEKPRFIIIGFQVKKETDNEAFDKSLFVHANLSNIHVTLNSRSYPEVDYDLNFGENKFSKIFRDAIKFKKNCFGMESSVNMSPFDYKDYYPLYVVDVSNQDKTIKGGTTDIIVKMKFNKTTETNMQAYAVIISDKIITFEADGSKMHVIQ